MSKPVVVEYKPELDLSAQNPDLSVLITDARQYMSTLAPRTARICHLYYTVGHTMLEISEIESISIKTVEKNLTKVGKLLRERYGT